MKSFIKKIFSKLVNLFFTNKFGLFVLDNLNYEINKNYKKITYKNLKINFSTVSFKSLQRANSFSFKEPETLDWIDSFEQNTIFFDVGANVGIFSIYAALKKNCNVFAFEPSIFNLGPLTKNIQLNNLEKKITIITAPVSDKSSINPFQYSSIEVGGAHNTFKENYGFDGNPLRKKYEYMVAGISLDDLIKFYKLKSPNYLKIDVDGIEQLILRGSLNMLQNLNSILIETNENFPEQHESIQKILLENNFKLTHGKYREKEMIGESKNFDKVYNQIWNKVNVF